MHLMRYFVQKQFAPFRLVLHGNYCLGNGVGLYVAGAGRPMLAHWTALDQNLCERSDHEQCCTHAQTSTQREAGEPL